MKHDKILFHGGHFDLLTNQWPDLCIDAAMGFLVPENVGKDTTILSLYILFLVLERKIILSKKLWRPFWIDHFGYESKYYDVLGLILFYGHHIASPKTNITFKLIVFICLIKDK